MAWTLTDDVTAFLSAAGGFLRSRPAENTLLLTITENLRLRGAERYGDEPPLFGWWTGAGGAVESAMLQTPPFPAVLTRSPDVAAASLAQAWDAGRPLVGVNAEESTAQAFAEAWCVRAGAGAKVRERERNRLYRLAGLLDPEPMPPGRARTAAEADRELLVCWLTEFTAEVTGPGPDVAALVEDRIGYGGLVLWELDGVPVSVAGLTRTVAGAVRVGPVYTPGALRGRRYAAAVTAAVSRAAVGAGAREVLLFTDLANPTSNALYQRIGYVPVTDRVILDFDL